jgi:RNA polymerase sigma-70 factor (ECF subfamily)
LADEARLLDRIRQYDQAALAQVYDQYYDRIYHYVFRFVGQVATAEDLTANVFLRLLKAVHSGNEPHTNLLAWLYRVAHNLVVDSFRRSPAAEDLELTEWLEGYDPDLTHIVEQRLQMERVRRALLDLTPAQQQVIVLKFLQGLDSVEVAAILNKSEGAIDALQHRALLALRQALKPPPEGGPGRRSENGEHSKHKTSSSAAPQSRASRMCAHAGGAATSALDALCSRLQTLCHSCRDVARSGNVTSQAYGDRRSVWSSLPAICRHCALRFAHGCLLAAINWVLP